MCSVEIMSPQENSVASKNKLELVPSKFHLYTFCDVIADKKVIFQVIKMIESSFIIINYKDNLTFDDLSFAMFNTRKMDCPISTRLMGNFVDESSKNLVLKCSKLLKKPVFVSCNLDSDKLVLPLVEKRLFEEIKSRPNDF